MTNDRELLELAAQAAGIEHGADRMECGLSLTGPDGRHRHLPQWNPLTDDGDALRLLAKLKLKLYFGETSAIVSKRMSHAYVSEETADDLMAATRRAIVRAAAEIGKD
jgi:hypothetical protein